MAEPSRNKDVELYWYQAQALEALDRGIRFCALIGGTGSGKALAVDTLIPTVNGFKQMGHLQVGDEVYDCRGRPTQISYVSPIYRAPWCFRLKFDDGTEVIADAEHRWVVQTRKQRKNSARQKVNPDLLFAAKRAQSRPGPRQAVLTTVEMAAALRGQGGAWNYSIDTVCVSGKDATLPIPPYTLGAWLGDGTAREATITCADSEILAHIQTEGITVALERAQPDNRSDVYRLGGGSRGGSQAKLSQTLQAKLRALGLLNNKHIPEQYLFASMSQRLALLQGLMDTDGHCTKSGSCEISISDEGLAASIISLLASLGIKARAHRGKTTHKDRYRITFTTLLPVFRLRRKLERLPSKTRASTRRRFLVGIESVPSVPVRCIGVTAETATYLCTRAFVVTHNTWFAPWWLATVVARDAQVGRHIGARYLAVAPTVEMTRDLLVPTIREAFRGTKLQGEYREQKNLYSLRTGGTIYFRSADKPERIEGHHVRGAWLDEPGQMKGYIWPIIQARTGYNQAPVLLTGYPSGTNWYYDEIYAPWRDGDLNYQVIQFASTDNPDYPAEEMERARQTLPTWLFEMRYLGQFRKPAGLVYPDFTSENNVVESFGPDPSWPLYAGIDPGSFFGCLFVYYHDGSWYIWREYYTEEIMGAAERSRQLREILEGRQPLAWIYDPARLQDVLDLGEHGIGPFYRANNAVMAGIETLTSLVKPGKFKVMRGQAPNFMDQMARYSFATDSATGIRKSENPIKAFDHLPDCARYIVHTLLGAPEQSEETVVFHRPVRISPY